MLLQFLDVYLFQQSEGVCFLTLCDVLLSNKLPRWVKLVLGSNLADVDDLDAEALLNLVSSQEVSWVIQRKKVHLGHMREALENKSVSGWL